MTKFLVLALATWRIAHAGVYEDGPWLLLRVVREYFGVEHDDEGDPISYPDGSVFQCVGCLSLWVALALVFLPHKLVLAFAASAIAKLINDRL